MKITHFNTFELEGGASRALLRLHKALIQKKIQSKIIVSQKKTDNAYVSSLLPNYYISKALSLIRPHLDSLPLKFYFNKKESHWSISWLPNFFRSSIKKYETHLVHIHWTCAGFLSVSNLASIKMPIIWTLHDAWAFTGGCHVIQDCERFKTGCGNCPQLGSSSMRDLSALGIYRKKKLFKKINPIFVAPSNWIADQARSSFLLNDAEIRVIPNGIDLNIYKPCNKEHARKVLGLPTNKAIVMFGALNATTDSNKGFQYIKEALRLLKMKKDTSEIHFVIFGASEPLNRTDFGLMTQYLGRLNDDASLALAYSSADIVCVPSKQESFGQVAMESLACGTPVVAFASSGLLDIVEHKKSGYLAIPYDTNDFSEGIKYLLKDNESSEKFSKAARDRAVEKFDIQKTSREYLNLYQEIISR